ncbi:MAG: hypothetical protein QOE70_5799 [Chthoniobacter sp.]|nr:hypothetical protein [Chthoniobacter sp.]
MAVILCAMFLRRNRRTLQGEIYEYWTLVKTVRTAKGPRQQVVATLGKEPGLESRTRHGWEDVADLLEGRAPAPVQGRLGELLAAAPEAPPTPWTQVDLRGLRVERVRDFGQVYLGLSLWRRLGLHTLLRELIEPGEEAVPWELTACILTLARFCGQKSELEVAERWYGDSALEDLLGVPFARINEARLYRGLDVLHAHKEKLCAQLHERYQSWFGVEFEFLLYDVTSTYFEGQAEGNKKAARGYSRDQRPDCKQVNIGLVVTPEGLPIGYESFAGNTADVTTVEEMVELMEKKYGQPKRVWVMDRGMVSEDNLEFLRERGARYLVGTPSASSKPSRHNSSTKRNGPKCNPASKSNWWRIPTAVPASSMCSAAPAPGAKKKSPCSSGSASACAPSSLKPMPLCSAAQPKTPARSSGALAAGWAASPPPSGWWKSSSSAIRRDAPAACKSPIAPIGRPGPNTPTARISCAPTAPSKTPPNSGVGISSSPKPKTPFASARAI